MERGAKLDEVKELNLTGCKLSLIDLSQFVNLERLSLNSNLMTAETLTGTSHQTTHTNTYPYILLIATHRVTISVHCDTYAHVGSNLEGWRDALTRAMGLH